LNNQWESIAEEAKVPEDLAGSRLDQAAARLFPNYSRARLQAWILSGQLTVNGAAVARVRDPVAEGDELVIRAELEVEGETEPQQLAFDVVYEDAHIAIVHKPAGLTVHPGAGVASGTLQNALLHRYPQTAPLPRSGLVHRLDKDTSGLLVVGLTLESLTELSRAMQAREIVREYDAVVWGRLVSGGTIDAPLGRDPRSRTKVAVVAGGRRAVTHYRIHQRYAWHTWLRVQLETGRTHQIRVHMRHIQHPLVGDAAYGGRLWRGTGIPGELRTTLAKYPRQALHARRLALSHPITGEPIVCETELPDDLRSLIDQLGQLSPDRGD
jgi:23S rRNA pseudouridine1911/1915/1917 synthase